MADNIILNTGVGGATLKTEEIGGFHYELIKLVFGEAGLATLVSATNPLPITLDTSTLATEATIAAVLAKIISAPSSEAKQDVIIAALASILAKIISSPATEAKQDTLIAKDFATQTTLAAILAKLIASPATEATLAAIQALLGTPTTILNGQTTVTTAGTRVVLAASTVCKSVTIKAFITNTGFIYVGNSTVTSANGFRLSVGDTVSLDISNLNTINLDSSVSGEAVSYIAIN